MGSDPIFRKWGLTPFFGFAVGLAFGLSFIPWGVVTGGGAFWDSAESDRAASLIGYLYFVADSWHWPLGAIATLNLPFGTNVVYTDSIPLLALPMKLLHGLGAPAWNYFGAWLLACFALNGLALALVLRAAGIRSALVTILAALLAAAMPMLLHRWYHFALCGQFVLLLGLACYVSIGHTRDVGRTLAANTALVVASIAIHPYLGAMVLGLFAATLMQAMRQRGGARRLAAINLIALGLALGAFAIALGYVSAEGTPVHAAGYGHFSANLLSPFASDLSALAPRSWERLREADVAASSWPFWKDAWPDATGGQGFEGFAYLGLGVLLLCALNVPYALRNVRDLAARHWPLLVVLVGATLFALSNRIYFDQTLLASFVLPTTLDVVVAIFRSSGRFLWLVAYAALAGVVVLTVRRFGVRRGAAILVVAVVLQLFDTTPLRRAIAHDARMTHTAGVDFAAWQPWLASNLERLEVVPSIECGDASLRNVKAALQYYAARIGPIPTNSAVLARGSKDCAAEVRRLSDRTVDPARVGWVFFADGAELPDVRRFIADPAHACQTIGDIVACKTGARNGV